MTKAEIVALVQATFNVFIDTPSVITYASTITLDMATVDSQTVSLTGNLTIATSNLAAGRSKQLRIICDSTTRTLTFPATWKFLGATAPTSIPASAVGILSIYSWSTTDANVVAGWSVTP